MEEKESKAICSECGCPIDIVDGEEWAYCPMCDNDQVEVARHKQITDLQSQLAQKDKQLEKLKSENHALISDNAYQEANIFELNSRIEQLQKQLAESEKEHELLIDQFEEETEKLRKQIKQESDARKRFVEEVKNLKQQLHDLPKKIVEEIQDNIEARNIDELKIIDRLANVLDTILKKYGGENE